MNIDELVKQIFTKQTYLCVGLDTDIEKLPHHLKNKKDAVVTFNKAIIDATKHHCVSYKINTAFYESRGIAGWQAMEETLQYIPETHFTIADAKRGDIGNTALQYAKTFFETLPFDSVTVNPYMGEDSVRPFLEYDNKVTILLGLTSNKGAQDFELLPIAQTSKKHTVKTETSKHELKVYYEEINEEEIILDTPIRHLYEVVLEKAALWGNPKNMMFVAGATQTEQLQRIRQIVPNHFLLVPGIGAQGGSLKDVSAVMNKQCGILVNASRAVIFASSGEDFAEKAAEAAKEYNLQMKPFIQNL